MTEIMMGLCRPESQRDGLQAARFVPFIAYCDSCYRKSLRRDLPCLSFLVWQHFHEHDTLFWQRLLITSLLDSQVAQVRISKIGVHGLFDRFNHDIDFNPAERITIMTGPNGIGKTMILRILDALFNRPVRSLEPMPFREVQVTFDDYSTIRVTRITGQRDSKGGRGDLTLELWQAGSTIPAEKFEPTEKTNEENMPFPSHAIGDFIPTLRRVGAEEWLDVRTNQLMDLDDVIVEYGDELPVVARTFDGSHRTFDVPQSIPSWLEEKRKAIPVRLIGTERLTNPSSNRRRAIASHRDYKRLAAHRTVRQYSEDLAQRVQRTLTEYGTLSQSLDRTFPARVVEAPTTFAPSVDVLKQKLSEVEERRSRLVEAGLLVQQEEDLRVPVIDAVAVDESRRGVLAVYAEDALSKLGVFEDLYDRINALKTIANARFLYKKVSVSTNGLEVEALDGSNLDLEMLSSGEQHELVLLYDLLFGVTENSLIMIDEPELSLHVAWQDEILSDLQKMADLSQFRALLATHSPQVIGDRWDLTVELKGPDEK